MNSKYTLVLSLLSVLAVAGCTGGGAATEALDENQSSTVPPPSPPPPSPTPPGSGSLIGSGSTSFTLSWTPPTTNSDGTALTNLAGYRIRIGLDSGDYTEIVDLNSAGLSRYVVDGVPQDTYFVVMTSVSSSGIESAYSQEVAALSN